MTRKRITVEVTDKQYEELKKYLQFGQQRQVFSIVIDDMLSMYEQYGPWFTLALLHKQISYKEHMKRYAERLAGV